MKIWLLLVAAFVCLCMFVHFASRTADKYANIPDELKESFRQLDADLARARVIDPKQRMVGFYTGTLLPSEAGTTTNLYGASASAITASSTTPSLVGLQQAALQRSAANAPHVYRGAHFEVMFIEEGGTSGPVITLSKGAPDCDEVIVTTFYGITMMIDGKPQDLLWTKTSVIPCVRGGGVVADTVPVTKDKIRSVKIKLVKVTNTDEVKIE